MKRYISLILVCIMIFSLCACSSDNGNSSDENTTKNNNKETSTTSLSEPSVSTKNDSVKINLNKYILVDFEGYNFAGFGSVKFDEEKFLLDHINNVSYNQDNFAVYKELYGNADESAAKSVLKYVSVSIENNRNLSNGDTVKIVWEIDKDKIDTYFELDYTCSEQTFTVEELKEASSFDPFKDVKVSFSGIAPYGSADVYNLATKYDGQFKVAPDKNLKNGDKVKVVFTCADKSTMIANYHMYPSSFEKTYVVSGLNTYVQSFSELSSEQQNKLISHAREKIDVLGYGNYKKAKYCGNYFYNAKDKEAHGVQFLSWCGLPVGNAVCFVFEHPEQIGVDNSPNVYSVITLENLLINEQGELIYSKHDMTQSFTKYKSVDDLNEAYVGVFDDIMYCSNNIKID